MGPGFRRDDVLCPGSVAQSLQRRLRYKPDAAVVFCVPDRDIGDPGAERAVTAGLDHPLDRVIFGI